MRLLILFSLVFLVACTTAHEEHTTTLPHGHDSMDHDMLELDAENAPTLDLVITEDSKAGWNLQILTTNFEWSPESTGSDHVAGQGHAHLYIDGEKITRLYGEWYHIPELTSGEHTIKVTLNSNSHEDFTVDGKMISDSETVIVS